VEAWLRDQKLNSLHEGTTGIQGMDLLGRKVVAAGGAALMALRQEIEKTAKKARDSAVAEDLVTSVLAAVSSIEGLTMELGAKGLAGDVAGMMLHSADYLELFSVLIIAWQHLDMAAAAKAMHPQTEDDTSFVRGKLLSAEYWIRTETGRLDWLAALCRSGEDSFSRARASDF
jgi:hypothetical protein